MRTLPRCEELELKCRLTEFEKDQKKDDFREWYKKKVIAETEKKSIVSKYGSIIKESETEMANLDEIIQSGEEKRGVQCEIAYDFTRGIKTWYRSDTGEMVKKGIISDSERQLEMDFLRDTRQTDYEVYQNIAKQKEETEKNDPEPETKQEQGQVSTEQLPEDIDPITDAIIEEAQNLIDLTKENQKGAEKSISEFIEDAENTIDRLNGNFKEKGKDKKKKPSPKKSATKKEPAKKKEEKNKPESYQKEEWETEEPTPEHEAEMF